MVNSHSSHATAPYYIILPSFVDHGNRCEQKEWTHYAKRNNIGIASLPDIYHKVSKTEDKQLISFLRRAFKEWLITSDQFNYHPTNLKTILTSHVEKTIIPQTQTKFLLPCWSRESLGSIWRRSSDEGPTAVRKLLKTTNNWKEIAYRLENLTDMSVNKILFLTPNKELRKINQPYFSSLAIRYSDTEEELYIDCDYTRPGCAIPLVED